MDSLCKFYALSILLPVKLSNNKVTIKLEPLSSWGFIQFDSKKAGDTK